MQVTEREPIDCDEALRRLAEYLDAELDALAGEELERHLHTCRSCYSRADFERRLRSRLRELRHTPVDPAFEDRICEVTRHFTTP